MEGPYDQIAALIAEAANPNGVMKYKEMPNGEQRFSVPFPNGEWILTVAGREGGWQNAHYHKGIHEHYVVHRGWIGLAFENGSEDGFGLCKFEVSDHTTFIPDEVHNFYLPPGAVISTVKSGKPVGNPDKNDNDWWPHHDLDAWSKRFDTEAKVLAAAEG